MAINSLTQTGAGSILQSLKSQNSRLAATVAHLASGRRFASAAEDVAALSAATALQSQVTSLRSASLNAAQASSLLQVADGGAAQIGSILDRMNAISVQANSGALSKSGREGLNTEFQGLLAEVNRLSGNTNFNGVNLLDGSLSASNQLQTSTVQGTKAGGQINFTANAVAGQTVRLNGQTLVAGTDFAIGASAAQTVQNLATSLNGNAAFDGFNFTATGNSLAIKSDVAGTAGNQFTINQAGSTFAFTTPGGDALTGAGVFSLTGGTDAGLSAGDTTVSGTSNDSLVVGPNNSAANSTISFNSATDIVAGNTISIDNGEGGMTAFTFVNGTPATNTQIQIGGTLEQTLENAASTMKNFSGPGDFGTRQLDFTVDGNNLVISGKNPGNVNDVNGTALNLALGTAGGTLSNATLNNGTSGGIDVSHVTSSGFTGTIQGFQATFGGVSNQVNLSVNVGGDTFTATVNNTNAAGNSTVRFQSQTGGFFDVTLAGGQGQAVGSQAQADSFGNRLDAAFTGITFRQEQNISNFNPVGNLQGGSFDLNSTQFSNLQFQGASASSNGSTSLLEIKIGGQTFRSDDLGTGIGAGERVTLTADNGDTLNFTNGINRVDLSSQIAADKFASQIEDGFDTGSGSSGLAFQIGSSSDSSVNFGIGDLSTKGLGLNGLDLLSLGGAQAASSAIGAALGSLTSQRANIGSYQQQLNYISAGIDSAIQNQDAARAVLQDTDFASESTLNVLSKMQTQASIASLAQTNKLSGNLLKLIGG